jgi:pimeloyl-ACP methyl ester carboxylesterase
LSYVDLEAFLPHNSTSSKSEITNLLTKIMASKPTIVVVPGSWHVPEHFEPTAVILRSHGYNVVGVRIPSARQSGPWTDLYTDAGAVSAAILAECDAGRDVVVIMHSLGGVAGSAAVKGLGKKEREEKGLKGGVIQLIYLSAFVIEEGVSLSDAFGFQKDADMQSPWCPVYEVCVSNSATIFISL